MNIKRGSNLLLGGCVALLVVLCWLSISAPMRFDAQRHQREQAVIGCLLQIRAAQESYHTAHGTYAPSVDSLVGARLLTPTDAVIPHSGGRKFEIRTAVATGASGAAVSLMECGATYDDYLQGLDPQEIERLTREANDNGKFAGLKIGDLTTPDNNAGNWE